MAEWFVRDAQSILIAVGRRSYSRPSRFFFLLFLGVFLFSFLALSRAGFCRVFAGVKT